MFVGHIGVAFAAKRVAPRTSLGTLVGAAVFLDLVWPIFVLAGAEMVRIDPGNTAFTPLDFVHYPFTHGAVAVMLWSAALGALVLARTGDGRGAAVVGALVASHWVLDLVTHRPDLPLLWSEPKVGLGLWNSVPATLAVELAIFAAGVALYVRATRPRDRAGGIALWALVLFLLVVYAANVLGPPPPSARAVAVAGLAQWLFVPWGAYIDRHRSARETSRRDAAVIA
jgi:membrane-bound metal-dependent hydrolase YbcI (DUF457 family)